MINHITIAGELTSEPHIRYTTEGIATTTLTVSVDRAESDPDPTTLTVICLGNLAENVALSLIRGCRIVASGRTGLWRFDDAGDPIGSTAEMLADEIGTSLRSATVDVHKVHRATEDES